MCLLVTMGITREEHQRQIPAQKPKSYELRLWTYSRYHQ